MPYDRIFLHGIETWLCTLLFRWSSIKHNDFACTYCSRQHSNSQTPAALQDSHSLKHKNKKGQTQKKGEVLECWQWKCSPFPAGVTKMTKFSDHRKEYLLEWIYTHPQGQLEFCVWAVSLCTNQRPFKTKTHLFVVHIGEINAIHFHYLISNLDFKEKI